MGRKEKEKAATSRPTAVDFFENAQKSLEPPPVEPQSIAAETRDELLTTVRAILQKGRAEYELEQDIIVNLRERLASKDAELMPTFALVKLLEIFGNQRNDFAGHVLKVVQATAEREGKGGNNGGNASSKFLDGRRVFLPNGQGGEVAYTKEQMQSASGILQTLANLAGAEIPEEIQNQIEKVSQAFAEDEQK